MRISQSRLRDGTKPCCGSRQKAAARHSCPRSPPKCNPLIEINRNQASHCFPSYEQRNKKRRCPRLYHVFGFSSWHHIRFYALSDSCLDRDSNFGLISLYCVASRGTSIGRRRLLGQTLMDDGLSPSKEDGWPCSCYAAFCGRCVGLWRAVRWNGSLRVRQNPAGCFLHQLLYVSLDRLLAETWLWSTCSARPARQQRSLACCTLSLAHLTNLDFQAPMKCCRKDKLRSKSRIGLSF